MKQEGRAADAAERKLARLRVVLVGTQHPGNIGAAARAMFTMGLTDLRLVAPRHLPNEQSTAMASGATHILDTARLHPTIIDAVADCTRVYATTARRRDLSLPFSTPRAFAEAFAQQRVAGPIALLFGPERIGLSNREMGHCQEAVEIPANPAYRSLNLAASVQVLSYELRQAVLAATPAEPPPHLPAPQSDMEHFFAHLERSLVTTGFLDPQAPRRLMPKLRRLFARAAPDDNELNILRGILTSVDESCRR